MITYLEKPHEKEKVKKILNPMVEKWFFSKFKEFSLPQLYGVLEIHNENNILIELQRPRFCETEFNVVASKIKTFNI